MSATFKNAKRKLPQAELRKFMNEHKSKNQTSKINSPLAKYNEAGQLTCILCQSIVRSEAVWNVHINAKQHKQNVEQAKALKEKTNNFTIAKKIISAPPLPESIKKVKGILKNSATSKPVIAPSNIVVIENTRKVGEKHKNQETHSNVQNKDKQYEQLPEDFFDSGPSNAKKSKGNVQNEDAEMDVDDDGQTEQIPEGFFDDPKLDAKARNIEFKDPIEEEWERFQKEIKDADHASAAIIAEDQEEATNERQIDEIEEQMKNWSRVVELEKKKVEIIQHATDVHMSIKEEDEDSSTDDDMDEFLDWRSKRA